MSKIKNGEKSPALILAFFAQDQLLKSVQKLLAEHWLVRPTAVRAVPEGTEMGVETDAVGLTTGIVQGILNYQIEKHGFYISPL